MSEENNNQPATPPINYEEHLDWFRVFVFIILPIQFIANINILQRYIRNFNEYNVIYASWILFIGFVTLVSITIIIIASVKQKPIGYKVIKYYSIFIIIYRILGFIIAYIYIMNQNPIVTSEYISTYSTIDIIYVLVHVGLSIINLIYFSHRKFLFGIPDEKSTTPAPEQEPKENHQ